MEYCRLQLDPSRKEPLYRQLYLAIAAQIRSGTLPQGEKLPGKRAMAGQLGVSQNTVETAYEMLLSEGYLRSKPRSGFYVQAMPTRPQVTAQGRPVCPPERPAPPQAVYDFATSAVDTACFPYATWARITRDIFSDHRELLSRGEPQGEIELREELCRYLAENRGMQVEPAQVVIGAGVEYLCGLIVRLLGGGCTFGLEEPGYQRNREIIYNQGCQVCALPVDGEGVDMAALDKGSAQAVYVTPAHQFPTGVMMSAARRMALLDWAEAAQGRMIIEDDYDSEFRYEFRPVPALQGLDTGGKVIYLNTFSRSLAPAFRMAYMVLPPQLLKRYRQDFAFYSCTVSRFEQQCLCRFIRDGHFSRHLNRARTLYRARRDTLMQELERMAPEGAIQFSGGQAGTHLIVTVANGMDEAALVGACLSQGVRVYGLSQFCAQDGTAHSASVVMGYAGMERGRIEQAVRRIGKAWFGD